MALLHKWAKPAHAKDNLSPPGLSNLFALAKTGCRATKPRVEFDVVEHRTAHARIPPMLRHGREKRGEQMERRGETQKRENGHWPSIL